MLELRERPGRGQSPPTVTAGHRLEELEREWERRGSDAGMIAEARALARRLGVEAPVWARQPSPGRLMRVPDPDLTPTQAVRYARRFGADEVYETARVSGWGAEALARLAAQLARADADWSLDAQERRMLNERLAAGAGNAG